MSPRITLILGTSNLVADAVSMAFGDYLSTRAELVRRESLWQTASLGTDQKASLKVRFCFPVFVAFHVLLLSTGQLHCAWTVRSGRVSNCVAVVA